MWRSWRQVVEEDLNLSESDSSGSEWEDDETENVQPTTSAEPALPILPSPPAPVTVPPPPAPAPKKTKRPPPLRKVVNQQAEALVMATRQPTNPTIITGKRRATEDQRERERQERHEAKKQRCASMSELEKYRVKLFQAQAADFEDVKVRTHVLQETIYEDNDLAHPTVIIREIWRS